MKKTTLLAIAAVAALALRVAACSDDERNQKIEATTSPQEFISLEINDPGAHAEARLVQDRLLVTYGIEIVTGSWAKSNFTVQLENMIPVLFYKFRNINSVTITATAELANDIRGHSQGRGDVMQAEFSRANVESIVWDKVYSHDLPAIADHFWQHPSLIKDAS
jgi:hypothetical protein